MKIFFSGIEELTTKTAILPQLASPRLRQCSRNSSSGTVRTALSDSVVIQLPLTLGKIKGLW